MSGSPPPIVIPGVGVGHWTDDVGRTGCTVVVLPPGSVVSGEVRGGAPATREFALLEPGRLVEHVDAVVLAGGSAFGLAAADGVVEVLEAVGRGFRTSVATVPIVVGMALFDLGVGEPGARPGSAAGAEAAREALASVGEPVELGAVGAGRGATVGKWRGPDRARPGGLGGFVARRDELFVAALVAVNAAGDLAPDSVAASIAAGDFDDWPRADAFEAPPLEQTTLGVLVTNATLDRTACHLVAQSAHDGLARALFPPHQRSDGDAVVVAATGTLDAPLDIVRVLAVAATEAAVASVEVVGD